MAITITSDNITRWGTFQPPLTFGFGNQGASWVPGPSGPIPDNRLCIQISGPWYGRAVQPFNAFGPTVGELRPWPQMVVNNSWATFVATFYVPGLTKPAPTPSDGF